MPAELLMHELIRQGDHICMNTALHDAHLFVQRLIAAASGPVIEGPRTLDVLRAIAARNGLVMSLRVLESRTYK
jgi:hypothetical protein